ncbi:MAG: hypothetical protein ACOC1F_05745 [Myxococcota bacterium]
MGCVLRWPGCLPSLLSSAARAETVRLISQANEPFNRRLEAELESMGLAVTSADTPLGQDTVAVVLIGRARVEIWMVDEARRMRLAWVEETQTEMVPETDGVRIAERVRALAFGMDHPLGASRCELQERATERLRRSERALCGHRAGRRVGR